MSNESIFGPNDGKVISLSPRLDTLHWIEELDATLRKFRFNFTGEKELQRGLAKAFEGLSEPFIAEHKFSSQDIFDFYWPAKHVIVEVKVDGTLSALTRQIHRYLQHEEVRGVLVVVSRPPLMNLPDTINKKPVRCHGLFGSLI